MTPRVFDPELPWGNWLRGEHIDGETVFVDEETGERWASLRAAFWNGRLGMSNYNREPPHELLETMHAVLVATVRRKPTFYEQAHDLFESSRLYLCLFHLWLAKEGLIELAENGHGANVNRRPKRTPYRRPKGTPFVVQRDGYGGRAVRAGCGVGRA